MPVETDGLTIYIKEITQAEANPNKVTIQTKETTPLTRDTQRISRIKSSVKGAALAKLALNNDIVTRVGDYSGNRNRQNQINNVRTIGNSLLNIGAATVGLGPAAGLGVAAYEVYNAAKSNIDYLNKIRKDDVRADVKLDASNGVLINNSVYKRRD